MSQNNKTTCPNCGVDIDVNNLLYHQLDKELKEKYQQRLQSEQNRFKARETQLSELEDKLATQESQFESTVQDKLKNQLAKEREKLAQQLECEQADRIKAMETELDEKSKKLIELNKAQAEITKLKRESQEQKTQIELALQQKFDQQLNERLTKQSVQLQQQLAEQTQFKVAEKEQVINQLKEQLSVAQRKAEQGSMQIQGEVQELAIEQWLSQTFPLDDIQEVKKGAQGADTLQIIHTRDLSNCGSIYYESKRTKAFQPAWIAKFKQDIQQKGASVGVLVTEAMPDGMNSLGQIDSVWVCTFEEFKNLSQVLRESIIQLHQSLLTRENKGDKMHMLYDFLTGSEFRMQIESIVEGFTQLKQDLESEKRALQGIWKKREKQIDRVLLNTNFMYSSIKGIAGSAIQPVAMLELEEEKEKSD